MYTVLYSICIEERISVEKNISLFTIEVSSSFLVDKTAGAEETGTDGDEEKDESNSGDNPNHHWRPVIIYNTTQQS